ncbi:MAG TPA: NADH-quinone oxidoreductase subunit C [Dehalococcoidia bacterium]|nr:NADH-quinone oxidoreductase subunit C [Dehalococcoidia bacterium]
MTILPDRGRTIPGTDVAARINLAFPDTVIEASEGSVTVHPGRLVDIARFLRDDDELDCKYLNCLTGVDWLEHFDVVYVLTSMAKNHMLILEARTSHDDPVVPSVSDVWQGAVLQEREVFDLMGIGFSGHPDLKRIFLWEGFPGHPLRKDFLAMQGGYKPGLQRFPYEFPEGQRSYPNLDQPGGPGAPSVPRLVGQLPGQAQAEETSGGQLGVGGGGSNETRGPRSDYVPPSEAPQIEAPDAESAPSEDEAESEGKESAE